MMALSLPCGAYAAPAPPPPPKARQVVTGTIAVTGTLSEHWRSEIAAGLTRGLTRAGFDAVIVDDATCQDRGCLAVRARSRGAMAVVTAAIDAEERFFRVRLHAYPLDGQTAIASVEEECPICGPGEVAALVERQATVLARKIPTTDPVGVLVVSTTPAGATIVLDGTSIGHSPMVLELPVGDHVVRAEAEGYEPLERTVTAAAQVRESWSATLRATAPPLSPRHRRLRATGWGLLGTGIAATVPAIVFIALDRRPFPLSCSGRQVDADGDCIRVYRTLPHGGAFLGAAAALITAGAIVLARSRDKSARRPTAARIRPHASGVQVAF